MIWPKVIKHKEKWLKLDPEHHDFESFIKYVIMECNKFRSNQKRMNTHWRPYYNKCGYCDVDYDVIGRAETFIDDTRYIFVLFFSFLAHLFFPHD